HRTFGAGDVDRSNWAAVAEHGYGHYAAITHRMRLAEKIIFLIVVNIGYIYGRLSENCTAGRAPACRASWKVATDGFQSVDIQRVSMRVMNQFAVECEHRSSSRPAQLPRIYRNRLEHGLHVALRLANHPRNSAGRVLL